MTEQVSPEGLESPEPQDPSDDAVDGVQDERDPGDERLRVVPRTPAQIVRNALAITTGYGGLCLKFTRTCANIPAVHGSAKHAWAAAVHKHAGYADAPAGAFLFMSHPNSKHGHVAVYLGDGTMRTTNSRTGRIHTDKVSAWVRGNYTVQGWTEDLNGVRVPGLAPVKRVGGGARPPTTAASSASSAPSTSASPASSGASPAATTASGGSGGTVLRRGSTGAAVSRLQRSLNAVFPAYSKLAVDGSYGPLTAGVVAEFQRRVGVRVTGDVDAATHRALTRHGVRF